MVALQDITVVLFQNTYTNHSPVLYCLIEDAMGLNLLWGSVGLKSSVVMFVLAVDTYSVTSSMIVNMFRACDS